MLRRACWLSSVALLGCAAVPPFPASGPKVVVMAWIDTAEHAGGTVPNAFAPALLEELKQRNIQATVVPSSGGTRPVDLRAKDLKAALAQGEIGLAIELSPRFYAQMQGRFRWTVACRLTAVTSDGVHTVQDQTLLPAILQFPSDGVPDAVNYATPEIARRSAAVLGRIALVASVTQSDAGQNPP